MISRHEYHNGVWIDLEKPTEEEIHEITKEFSISKIVERESILPTPSPLVISDSTTTFAALHFPAHGAREDTTESQEVDFIIGEHFIVTVRYEVIAPLYHLKKLLETQQLIAEDAGNEMLATDALLEVIFLHLYTAVRDHTDHVADNLTRVEKEMFNEHERQTVRTISGISREFLHMESVLANQEESLNHFLQVLTKREYFGAAFAERAERILAERAQLAQLVKIHRAIATEMRETNVALIDVRQNEIMKTLTIVNFIFLPLGLISWTFSMRTEGMPLIDSPNAFWIVLAIMLGVTVLLTTFFIKRRWL